MIPSIGNHMLTLICGVPNAGKTTYSQRYSNVIHLDDIRSRDKSVTKVIEDMVSEQEDVCVEGTYLAARQRRGLPAAYKGGRKVCIWLDTPLDVCIARENRGRRNGLHIMCAQAIQPPTLDEGWDEIIVVKPDGSETRISEKENVT